MAAHAGLSDAAQSPLKAIRLTDRWPDILQAAETLGEVTAITRNDACVHEKVGTYRHCSVNGSVGLVLGGEIDLRVFYAHWAHGFAAAEHTARGVQRSLQFFDAQGTALHKIFLRQGAAEADAVAAFDALVAAYRAPGTLPGITPVQAPPATPDIPDDQVDIAAFRAGWRSMRDTHEFFGLLKQHRLSRTQALRLAEPEFAKPVPPASVRHLLQRASQAGTPIMVFVGNPGMIQIHSGPVHRIEVHGPWLNVLDPGFNLHLREDHLATAWQVRKPTTDGLVSSLEVFDGQGRTVAMFFGERKPGQAERHDWRQLLQASHPEDATCAA